MTLNGRPVDVSTRAAFRRYKSEVQLVFQDPFSSLNPVHTVRYHLQRPVKLHQGKSRGEIDTEVVALMEQVRLTPAQQFLAKFPHELSGGQRQRVSFARALAARPSVLLADEPVSMLDVSIRLEMLNLLDDLRQRFHLALLYITHDIASARYFADEVLVMYAGEIVERGPGRGGHPAAGAPLHAATGFVRAGSRQPGQRPAERRPAQRSHFGQRRARCRWLPLQPPLPVGRGPLPCPGSALDAGLRLPSRGMLAPRRGGTRAGGRRRSHRRPADRVTPTASRSRNANGQPIASWQRSLRAGGQRRPGRTPLAAGARPR